MNSTREREKIASRVTLCNLIKDFSKSGDRVGRFCLRGGQRRCLADSYFRSRFQMIHRSCVENVELRDADRAKFEEDTISEPRTCTSHVVYIIIILYYLYYQR